MRALMVAAAALFWLAVGVLGTILGGCAGVPCVCVCDDGQPRQRAESPAHVRALEVTRRLEAEAERMRAQIRAWDEVETLEAAAEAVDEEVNHVAR
jgi:hypothetical protein